MKIRNVAFVRTDNPGYREHAAQHAQASKRLRPTLGQTVLQKVSKHIEILLRRWLGKHLPLSPRRILRYDRLRRTGSYSTYYKEIDAVEVNPSEEKFQPVRIFEFKCSKNASAIRSADQQLRRAIKPLRCRWSNIYRHAILVAVTPERMNLQEDLVSLAEFDASVPKDMDNSRCIITYLSAEELWSWGLDADLLDAPPALLEEAQEAARVKIEKQKRRTKLKEKGVPQSEWPEELRPHAPEVPDSEVATFGDHSGESPLARELRKALDKNS